MEIILTSLDPQLTKAWKTFCGDVEGVEIHKGSILEVDCDAIVSPANSFGFMDGGIDAVYTNHFGKQLQQRVQQRIKEVHHGELLVGQADIFPTDGSPAFLIVAPTMRVPMILRDSVNAYLAARAVLLLVKHGVFSTGPDQDTPIAQKIKRVAFPGLGTGVGQISGATCAHQVRMALDEVLLGKHDFPATWADAQARHQLLYTDRVRNLQKAD
ncbi:MAG: macro domain-containing protein [Cyanobacteriota bacterium]|nr:macro domain-containing protein [Cyanobacteriota bacterium]